jgi:hypothetical protein
MLLGATVMHELSPEIEHYALLLQSDMTCECRCCHVVVDTAAGDP